MFGDSLDGRVAEPSLAKSRVKTTALALFSQRGFRSVSVRDIMNACGLTAGALYAHYASKEELLLSLILEGHERLHARLEALFRLQGNPAERLARLSYVHMLFQLRNLELARVTGAEYRYLPDAMRGEIDALRARMTSYVEVTLDQGIAQGVFDIAHPVPMRLEILAGANSAPQWYDPHGPMTAEAIAAWHATMALRIALTRGPAADGAEALVASALKVMQLGWDELRAATERSAAGDAGGAEP